jgi:hypothetical protein
VVVFVDVVDRSDVEPRAVVAINRVSGLMEYFSADSQFVGHFSLQQHTREPKILVCAALVDPITATAIDGPIAEALSSASGVRFKRGLLGDHGGGG